MPLLDQSVGLGRLCQWESTADMDLQPSLFDPLAALPQDLPLVVAGLGQLPQQWGEHELEADAQVSVARLLPLHSTRVQQGDQVAVVGHRRDAGFEHLNGLTNITYLNLSRIPVTDAGLEHLKGMTNLRTLSLFRTEVTDAGLVHLKGLSSLQSLALWGDQITDAGLEHLRGLTDLNTLALFDTHVTDEGTQKLRQALPYCEILTN